MAVAQRMGLWAVLLLYSLYTAALQAEELDHWQVTGEVALDGQQVRDTGPALRLAPRAQAVQRLRERDGAGSVSLWVYDDGRVPSQPKQRRDGPRWGVLQANGRVLVVGALYAPYLGKGHGYSAAQFDPNKAKDHAYTHAQWLGVTRKPGLWRHWQFDFDPEQGFSLSVDDKPVSRFDWNKTEAKGFVGVVLLGDSQVDGGQTLWVDQVEVQLGGAMEVAPIPPGPILPASDPEAEGDRVSIAKGHPRLLLRRDRLDALRTFYHSEAGRPYREVMEATLPNCVIPEGRKLTLNWGREQGLSHMPTVALHYLLTGDPTSLEKGKAYLRWLAATTNWSLGGEPASEDYAGVLARFMLLQPMGERNSDTTAAFTLVGAALTWDWLYDELEPQFREQFRQILWQHVRAMYYGGHLGHNPGGRYWHGQPNYNHRWFRDWGLGVATFAAAEGRDEEQWLLQAVTAELRDNVQWLPEDGSHHEGPTYGRVAGGLGMALEVADSVSGTQFLDAPFFHALPLYSLAVSAPGLRVPLYFSDSHMDAPPLSAFQLQMANRFGLKDEAAGLLQGLQGSLNTWSIGHMAWQLLLVAEATQAGGDIHRLPTALLAPDQGVATVRDGWDADAVALLFKAGPPGGYKGNLWREQRYQAALAKDAAEPVPEGGRKRRVTYPYLNVAHDLPDANSFILFAQGEFLAEANRYPTEPGKLSTGHNTLLINGIGQVPFGRDEGPVWAQPGAEDMRDMARILRWEVQGDLVVMEGEASGAYRQYPAHSKTPQRPDLEGFRRTLIWLKGDYLLVLDAVRAPEEVEVTWLMQGEQVRALDAEAGHYRLSKGAAQCDFLLRADLPLQSHMGTSSANFRGKALGWEQLQAVARGRTVRFVALFDPWQRGDLQLHWDGDSVRVEGAGIDDQWHWQPASGHFIPSGLSGMRQGGFHYQSAPTEPEG